MPNSSFVGHAGNGPPGVVGSLIQTATHVAPTAAATASGAPKRSTPRGVDAAWRSINTRYRLPKADLR